MALPGDREHACLSVCHTPSRERVDVSCVLSWRARYEVWRGGEPCSFTAFLRGSPLTEITLCEGTIVVGGCVDECRSRRESTTTDESELLLQPDLRSGKGTR